MLYTEAVDRLQALGAELHTPAGQRSEFLLEHGMLDAVVPRQELKAYIERALSFMTAAA
ncbi:MAG TPA: hypothetical protein VGM02_02105 [Acidobacteriaceae bacterium]|jgi:acetyl-CoA carboxylase beta subunit